jgi:hypothetical protein
MNNARALKIALCEATKVVLRPNTPYVFEAVPGCEACIELVEAANENYSKLGEKHGFTNPKTSHLPIYASTQAIPTITEKKAKGKAAKK